MNLQRFACDLPDHYDNLIRPTGFTRPEYELSMPTPIRASDWNSQSHDPTTPYIGHLLNFAVSLMSPAEVQLQAGRLSQLAIKWSLQNRLHTLYTIGTNYMPTKSNTRSAKGQQIQHFSRLPSQVLRQRPLFTRQKVGVCYYDPTADPQEFFTFLQLIPAFLADQAVLIVAQGNQPLIREALFNWIEKYPEFELFFDLPTPTPTDPAWGDGVLVIGYQKGS